MTKGKIVVNQVYEGIQGKLILVRVARGSS